MSALFISLTWWQVALLGLYVLYTLIRAFKYFVDGVKESLLGYKQVEIKLYHIILFVIDIPSIVMGRFYHVLKRIFSFKLYTLKEEKEQK